MESDTKIKFGLLIKEGEIDYLLVLNIFYSKRDLWWFAREFNTGFTNTEKIYLLPKSNNKDFAFYINICLDHWT
jgi:hypothetical protein